MANAAAQKQDIFTRWMLGITATTVVAVGGWIGTTITSLNERFKVLETEMTYIRVSMSELALDAKQTRMEVSLLRERIIKIEIRMEQDHTKVQR